MMRYDDKGIRELVKARLAAMPPNVNFPSAAAATARPRTL